MGLAEEAASGEWRVRRDFEGVLRAMQRVGDRQKMLAAHGAGKEARDRWCSGGAAEDRCRRRPPKARHILFTTGGRNARAPIFTGVRAFRVAHGLKSRFHISHLDRSKY